MMTPGIDLDLFAGPGGWSHAARALRLTEIGIELEPNACATRRAAGHTTVRADVALLPVTHLSGRIRGLIGSPPCQGFSLAGLRAGLSDLDVIRLLLSDLARGEDTRAALAALVADPRSLLVAEPLRYALAARPEWIVLEQVPAVLPMWEETARHLRAAGYSTWTGVLNAADYGVPQTRRRAILIASRIRQVHRPEPTHARTPDDAVLFGPCRKPWVTMADALGWGATDRTAPTVTAGGGKTGGPEPFPSRARELLAAERDAGRWVLHTNRAQRPDGSRQTTNPHRAPSPAFTGKSGSQWVLEDATWTRQHPATTVSSTARIARPGHRDRTGGERQFHDSVRITVPEASILQGFPADYPWQGTKTRVFEQMGNAVPPLATAVLAVAAGIEVHA